MSELEEKLLHQLRSEKIARTVVGITRRETMDWATGYQIGSGVPALIIIGDENQEIGAVSLLPKRMFLSDLIKLYAKDGLSGYSKDMTEPITYYKNPDSIFDPVGSKTNNTGVDRVWHCDPTGRPIEK